jgi:oxygen-independent coproporphyrinogen-3 oxidase
MQTARLVGFRGVNLDLIYGLPRQTPDSFRRTVEQVVALAPDRVAVFSFAYVPALKPHQRRLPMADIPSGAAKLELFLVAREALTAAGYRAIGMDHFARSDDELARAAERGALGRDFQGYTVERAPDTVALGASSISALGDCYAQNAKSLGDYERAVASGRLATERGLQLGPEDLRRRRVIGDVMCNFAVELERYGDGWARELDALGPLARDGLVNIAGRRVEVTPLGRLFVRNVAMVFDQYLPGAGQARAQSRSI